MKFVSDTLQSKTLYGPEIIFMRYSTLDEFRGGPDTWKPRRGKTLEPTESTIFLLAFRRVPSPDMGIVCVCVCVQRPSNNSKVTLTRFRIGGAARFCQMFEKNSTETV